MKKVTIFIPALNEEKHVGKVIEEIPLKEIREMGFGVEVLVVNGPSTDRTKEIALSKGAKVIPTKKGKGNAVRDAFNYIQSDYTVMLDADETYPGEYIIPILKELEKGNEVVLGSRLEGKIEEGAMSSLNKLGNRFLTNLANLLFGTKISDLCTGYWGFRKKVIKEIDIAAEGFDVEANMFSECAKKEYKFSEINISYRKRSDETKLRAIDDGTKIARRLFDLKFLGNKKVIKHNLILLPSLLIFNLIIHLLIHFNLIQNFLTSIYSFKLFGLELMPLIISSGLIVLTYGLMIYMTKGNFTATFFSTLTLILSTNFVISIYSMKLELLIGFGLFIFSLYGILVTFGRENMPRYLFTLIPYSILFFINRELFAVLFFVFIFYLATEYKKITSKKLVWFWIGASLVILLLTTNLFAFHLTSIHLLYYFSIFHFAVAMLGFYHSVFERRARILVILLVFLLFLSYLIQVIAINLFVSQAIFVTMLVYTIILLTGIGIERIIHYGRKFVGF